MSSKEHLRNISAGGLAFIAKQHIPLNSLIEITIPVFQPETLMRGMVVWCRPSEEGGFEVGVRFEDADMHFRMRMVQQVCYIEQYKKDLLEKEGRRLTGEEAAREWIERFAGDFPA
jgi:hypothetical protein